MRLLNVRYFYYVPRTTSGLIVLCDDHCCTVITTYCKLSRQEIKKCDLSTTQLKKFSHGKLQI